MRHIRTLIVALVVAPLVWVLLALGQVRSAGAFPGTEHGSALHPGDFVRPALLLAVAGLLLGVLGTLRISPLGAMTIGVVYTLSYTLLLVAPSMMRDLLGHDLWVAGHHIDLAEPVRTGTTMVLGVLLLVAAASMQRWRRWPRLDDMEREAAAADRPLGTEGLGLTPAYQERTSAYQDAEPELAGHYTTAPERHSTSARPDPREDSPLPARSWATRTSYDW